MHLLTHHSRSDGPDFPGEGGPLRATIGGARLQVEDIFRRQGDDHFPGHHPSAEHRGRAADPRQRLWMHPA